jgi:membrane protease YdiL (CAAX protease family)
MVRVLLIALWAIASVAGYLYAQQQHIPVETALKVLPAFLMEVGFFYVLGMDRLRARVEKWAPSVTALALTAAAVLPYSEAELALRSFSGRSFLIILCLAAVVAFWYVVLPQRPATDILLLAVVGFVWLSKILPQQYPSPPKVQLVALAQLMWFRTGVFAMVVLRKSYNVGFGLWPDKRQWRVGVVWYFVFLPVAAAIAWWVGFAKPRLPQYSLDKTLLFGVATFFGVLWVLALGEEFFFRGLLQQWMTSWFGEWGGLIGASFVFGSAHLWFRGFPNYKIVPLAVLLGLCCGMAFKQTKSIRASMVTHAFVVTTWRLFFWG